MTPMPKIDAPTGDLIGSADVCQLAGIDRSTLSRHVAAGHITPRVRMPGRTGAWLFDKQDVALYIARHRPHRIVGGGAA